MILPYYCSSCDFSFSVVDTGHGPTVRCPRCRSGVPQRIHRKYNNSPAGFFLLGSSVDVDE